MVKRRQQLEEAAKGVAVVGDVEKRLRPPILDEVINTGRAEELPDLVVVPVGGPPEDPRVVFETLLQARGPMTSCYERARAADPSFSKRVSLLVEIAPDGGLRSSHVLDEGPASKAGRCLAPYLQHLRFPEHKGTELSRYGVFFRPRLERAKSAPLPATRTDRAPVADARSSPRPRDESSGPLTLRLVRQILTRSMGGFGACYRRALRHRPGLSGRLTVHFVVGSGGVRSTRVEASTLPAEVSDCITARLRMLRFPPPEGGNIPFSHTFVFRD
jgi:hypothetical protein